LIIENLEGILAYFHIGLPVLNVEGITSLVLGEKWQELIEIVDDVELLKNIEKVPIETLIKLGSLYLFFYRLKDAEKCFKQVLENQPSIVSGWAGLSEVYRKFGNFLKAEECSAQAINLDPLNVESLVNAGNVQVDIGGGENLEKAKTYYEKALEKLREIEEVTPEVIISESIILNNIAVALRDEGNPRGYLKAREYCERALNIAKELSKNIEDAEIQVAVVLNTLSNILHELGYGNLKEAQKCCEDALGIFRKWEEDISRIVFDEGRVVNGLSAILLDLGSGNLDLLSDTKNQLFIIDHHEISGKIPRNIRIFNPHLLDNTEDLCTSELVYLICREFSEDNKSLANLAIIGMVGDVMEHEINKIRNLIIKDANVKVKKGLLLYPSTRPLDKTLEYSSRPFIPGVTGDSKGTYELLKEAGIEKIGRGFKALIDLSEQEMKNLVTAVMLRLSSEKASEYLGNLYLLKFFNKIEDARELSAIINACGRMDMPEIALMFCLGNNYARKRAERVYVKYRQHIISGLKYIEKNGNIKGKKYVIINTRDKVKDTIIGTLASILSFSSLYKEGTIIIAMAYNEDKIKVSTRMAGRNPRSPWNLKKLMDSITYTLGCRNSGGHRKAAGCIIKKEDENKFIDLIKRKLEVELVKI